MAERFRKEYPFHGELYIDPKLNTYKAFNLQSGVWKTFGINKSWIKMASSVLMGDVKFGEVQGDTLQQGGSFIVGPGNQISYGYINQYTGDHASNEDILKHIKL